MRTMLLHVRPASGAGRRRAYRVIGLMRNSCSTLAIAALVFLLVLTCAAAGCARTHASTSVTGPGQPLLRQGDEIMVAGQLFHTGAPVVLWTDPGGYDAYRVDRRFAPPDK